MEILAKEYGDQRGSTVAGVYLVRIAGPVEDASLREGQPVALVHVSDVEQTGEGPAPAPGEEVGEPLIFKADMVVLVDAETGEFIRADYIEVSGT